MLNKIKKIMVFFLLSFMSISTPMSVYAASNGVDASIQIEQVFSSNTKDVEGVFNYSLHPVDATNPMPKDVDKDGNYYFSINGNSAFNLEAIHFERTGIYSYEICQVVSNKKENYSYDSEKYKVQVVVKNSKDGGLLAEIQLPVNASGKKTESIKFTNSYTKPAIIDNGDKNNKQDKVADTRDNAQITLWTVAAASSICLLVVLICVRRKKEDEEYTQTCKGGEQQ